MRPIPVGPALHLPAPPLTPMPAALAGKLDALREKALPLARRAAKIYLNPFEKVSEDFLQLHQEQLQLLMGETYRHLVAPVKQEPPSRVEDWEKRARFQFVAVFPCDGLDCHRTWETLALGAIPIVLNVSAGLSNVYVFKGRNRMYTKQG